MSNYNPNQETCESQSQMILAALQRGETLTPIDALRRFGCFRLGARIFDLKARGYRIEGIWQGTGRKKYMSYKLAEQ